MLLRWEIIWNEGVGNALGMKQQLQYATMPNERKSPILRDYEGSGEMCTHGARSGRFDVEFAMQFDGHNKIRTLSIKRTDGADIPDGDYDLYYELGERRRRLKKWNGNWQMKWRHRWEGQ